MTWLQSSSYYSNEDNRFSSIVVCNKEQINDIAEKSSNWDLASAFRGELDEWIRMVTWYPIQIKNLQRNGYITDKQYEIVFSTLPVVGATGAYCYNVNTKMFNEKLPIGEVYIPTYYRDYRDYEPYTSVEIFLPYYGYTSLKCADCLGEIVIISMGVDWTTGSAVYYITRKTDGRVIGTYSFQLGVAIPLGQSGVQNAFRNVAMGVVKGAATVAGAYFGGVAGAGISTTITTSTESNESEARALNPSTGRMRKVSSTQDTSNGYRESRHTSNAWKGRAISGVFDTAANAIANFQFHPSVDRANHAGADKFSPLNAKIVIRRAKFVDMGADYNHLYGLPLGKTKVLSSVKGYTECSAMHLEGAGFKACTPEEKDIISAALSNGVILPGEVVKHTLSTTVQVDGENVYTSSAIGTAPVLSIKVTDTGLEVRNDAGETVETWAYAGDGVFTGFVADGYKYTIGSVYPVGGGDTSIVLDLSPQVVYDIVIKISLKTVFEAKTTKPVRIVIGNTGSGMDYKTKYLYGCKIYEGDSGVPIVWIAPNKTKNLIGFSEALGARLKYPINTTITIEPTSNQTLLLFPKYIDAPIFTTRITIDSTDYDFTYKNYSPDVTFTVTDTGVTFTNYDNTSQTARYVYTGFGEFAAMIYDEDTYNISADGTVYGWDGEDTAVEMTPFAWSIDPTIKPEPLKLYTLDGSSFTIRCKYAGINNLRYSWDNVTWVELTGGISRLTSLTVPGGVVYLSGVNASFNYILPNDRGVGMYFDKDVMCTGDLASLLTFRGAVTKVPARQFFGFFIESDHLLCPPVLAAKTMEGRCYEALCLGCVKMRVYTEPRPGYTRPWRVPISGTGKVVPDDSGTQFSPLEEAFSDTSGDAVGTLNINTTYYIKDL